MGALRTSSYQVTQPGLVSTRQYPVNRSTGQLKDTEVCQLAGQIGTGHCTDIVTVNLSGYLR
jgi:hypothetical protein